MYLPRLPASPSIYLQAIHARRCIPFKTRLLHAVHSDCYAPVQSGAHPYTRPVQPSRSVCLSVFQCCCFAALVLPLRQAGADCACFFTSLVSEVLKTRLKPDDSAILGNSGGSSTHGRKGLLIKPLSSCFNDDLRAAGVSALSLSMLKLHGGSSLCAPSSASPFDVRERLLRICVAIALPRSSVVCVCIPTSCLLLLLLGRVWVGWCGRPAVLDVRLLVLSA
mmetsp:Transcript_52394/g.131694  ORF Transcript_52394/g.131694 Transcript_52394/m.131694 type:complete len:222 (+) Transcript_52394:2428-3093(+)